MVLSTTTKFICGGFMTKRQAETNYDEVAIAIDDLSKSFILPHEHSNSLKNSAINLLRSKPKDETLDVLRNISFDIKRGEFFGILGRNGSGKSTLLKLLASIYAPTRGSITVNGHLTPFIELGVGFNPELTGAENVYLNGAILGLTEDEITKKYDKIVKFAELERFMDQKLKNYSSGMQVRLAFAISIHAHNEILLIDEVLAVGDERFQNKCLSVFRKIKEDPDQTVVFVSHDMGSVQRFCDRVAVIHDGDLKFVGDTQEGTLLYKKLNFPEAFENEKYSDQDRRVDISITNTKGGRQKVFNADDDMVITVHMKDGELQRTVTNAGISVITNDNTYVFGANAKLDDVKIKGDFSLRMRLNLGAGRYFIKLGLFDSGEDNIKLFSERAAEFIVNGSKHWDGLTKLDHTWNTTT